MARSTKSRKNKSRKSRRRTVSRKRDSVFPPIIPFNRVFLNVVMRQVIQYPKQELNSTITGSVTVKSMFDGMWKKLGECFSQVWITKIHVYAMTGVGFDEPGYHLMNVAPDKEFEVSANTSFATMAGLPGTRTSRITRMVSGIWYPTGMDERLWFKTDSSTVLTDYIYKASCQKAGGTATTSFPLDITIDCHVKLRGINYQSLQRSADEHGLDVEFVNLAT